MYPEYFDIFSTLGGHIFFVYLIVCIKNIKKKMGKRMSMGIMIEYSFVSEYIQQMISNMINNKIYF